MASTRALAARTCSSRVSQRHSLLSSSSSSKQLHARITCKKRSVSAHDAAEGDVHLGPAPDILEDGLLAVHHPGNFPETSVSQQSGLQQDKAMPAAAAFDPLRDGPLRYCGYANELGEAFASWLPFFGVPASYAIAILYCSIDTYDKTSKAYYAAEASVKGKETPSDVNLFTIITLLASERAVDTLLWQLLASVAIPGFTIHQVVWVTHLLLSWGLHFGDAEHMPAAVTTALEATAAVSGQTSQQVSGVVEKVVPTMAGLAAIPIIIHPIDNAVHALLDRTLRPYMKNVICEGARGQEVGLDICEVDFSKSQATGDAVQGIAVSSFDYGSCIDQENCSVVQEYNRHSGDAKRKNLKVALAKAVLLSGPVAILLLASQMH